MKRGAVTAIGLAALLGTQGAVPDAAISAAPSAANLCRGGERVVYSCRFGPKLGSVCLGKRSVHYRFGRSGRPELDLSSAPDWGNVHLGGNRSQAGLNQDHIRFTNQDTHYIVHSGATGPLNERPGARISGIVVLRGAAGQDELASLDCKAGTQFNFNAFTALSGVAPEGWDGGEDHDGPFDGIY